ncbi:MAG TPA: DNA polymerase III subunit alpha [bacterium]|nr:DNA polymerase III subunit alpha [bacterium]
MPTPFVHCHLHTEYSLLDGHSRITPLIARAQALGMPAIALTDHGAMYGAVEFYTKAREAGITPIIGLEAYLAPRTMADRDPKLDGNAFHMVLLATSEEGYRNLIKLTTTAHLEGFYYKPRIDRDLLARHSAGLIGLSGCLKGEVTQALLRGDEPGAREIAGRCADIFGSGNFYLEVQSHGLPEQQQNVVGMRRIAQALELPLIATNDVHYVERGDADAQDALMCIQMNINLDVADKPRMGGTPEFYLKSGEEMARAFAEVPEALRAGLEIAERARFDLELGSIKLPHFPVPAGETADSYLRRLCENGLGQKYGAAAPEVRQRLDYELAVIERMGYAAYFLIVQDFVNFAKRSGILTTVRGSAAGSLVLYALNVTDVDPLAYRLPFERFLNPQRVTMPDIDVDFMDSRRDEVIRYVMERYGADHVAQIITFGTMGARQAVRDVGRVMGLAYGDVDRIAKLIPFGVTLDEAVRAEPELQRAAEENAQITRLLDLARKLEGVARHASTHAAGIIISRDPLTEHVPLQRATKSEAQAAVRPEGETAAVMPMTQYDMTAVEKIGLLKMDFLGLANLTILDRAMTIIGKTRRVTVDLQAIPLDDRKTFDLLAAGETVGVFQLEGAGMTRYLKELRPSSIQDIMAMVALFRPGPMANIPSYIRRKHGQEPITVLHPVLEPVLRETYGVMVYQEDVMAVAQAAAGFSSAEADVLRYAIGKKIRDKLQQQRTKFIAGCVDRGLSGTVAESLFELFEPFARYGFNRAHAACYGLIAYYTAYLKANFPVEYMAAVLSSDVGNAEKVAGAVAEAQRMGIAVLPPNVNESFENFTVVGDAIRFGLAAVKNVGFGSVEAILEARKAGGSFTSLLDLLERVDPRALNKRVLESLIKAGALDGLGRRAQMLALLDSSLEAAQRIQRERASGQTGLFDAGPAAPSPIDALEVEEFSKDELLLMEKEMLGLYISDHPLRQVQAQLAARVSMALSALHELPDKATVTVGGIITTVKRTTTKSGSAMAFVTLEDLTGGAEVIIFPKTYEQVHFLLKRDAVVVVRGKVDVAEQQAKILADRLQPLEEAEEVEPPAAEAPRNGPPAGGRNGDPAGPAAAPPPVRTLHVRVDAAQVGEAGLTRLHDVLGRQRGPEPVVLHLVSAGREVVLNARELRVAATVELRTELETLFGAGSVWQE